MLHKTLLGTTALLLTAAGTQAAVVTFRQNLNGYLGTADTGLREAAPDTPLGAESAISVDAGDPVPLQAQALLRFDNLVGNNPGQVPPDATINSATLRLEITSTGSGLNFHRMLRSWDEDTATWNSMSGGLTADGTEAATTATLSVGANNGSGNIPTGAFTANLTADVQAWANGAANFGWAILPFTPNGTNGVDFNTSEIGLGLEPALTIDFTPIPEPSMLAGLALAAVALTSRRRRA